MATSVGSVDATPFFPPPTAPGLSAVSLRSNLDSSSRVTSDASFSLVNAGTSSLASQPNASSAKLTRKTKDKTPATSSDTNAEFLKRELSAAQARIAVLDTTVKDKEQQVSILMARGKSLEEKVNNEIYEKYFPQNQPDSNQTRQKPTTLPPSCNLSPQCGSSHSKQPCQPSISCFCHPFYHHECRHGLTQGSSLPDMSQQVLKIVEIISEVRTKVDNIEAIHKEQRDNNARIDTHAATSQSVTEVSNNRTRHDAASTESSRETLLNDSITS